MHPARAVWVGDPECNQVHSMNMPMITSFPTTGAKCMTHVGTYIERNVSDSVHDLSLASALLCTSRKSVKGDVLARLAVFRAS